MKQITLIPLAGEGSRFKATKYKDPKPLIQVDGMPMIVRAVEDLPVGNDFIFIVRKEHIDQYPLKKILEQQYKNCKIIAVDYLTEGQASTCLLARENINNDNALLIGACDNGALYDKKKFQNLVADDKVDVIVFSFRNNVTVESKPEAYGWINVDKDNNAQSISVKEQISDTPINDHAVVGTFWFRYGRDFVAAAEDMIDRNIRVNNEFYVDECINNAIALGLRVKVLEIDTYVCWGTPEDLKTYNYWKEYFNQHHGRKI